MIRYDTISNPILDHIRWSMSLILIDKPGNHITITIKLSHRIQLILVNKALHKSPINLLPYSPVLAVKYILNLRHIRQLHIIQVTH